MSIENGYVYEGEDGWMDIQQASKTEIFYFPGEAQFFAYEVPRNQVALILSNDNKTDNYLLVGTLQELHRKVSEMMDAITECMAREPGDHWAGHSRRWEGRDGRLHH